MSEIQLNLKTYEQLQFEITKLNTDLFLKDKKIERLKENNQAMQEELCKVWEERDDVLEEFEDWLERQKTRNSEWDNFIMVDGRLGIPISYLLNKLQELKGSDKE